MADRRQALLGLYQQILGSISAVELAALEREVFERLLSSGITIGDSGVIGLSQASGILLAAGTIELTANWDAGSYKITAQQLESDVTTGTAPLVVASTTVVTNLNADQLDGNEASAFVTASGNSTLSGDSTVTGSLTFDADALHILDTNASHDLIVTPGSDLTADRTLTLTTGDADRTLTLGSNVSLNQDVQTTDSPTFADLTLSGGDLIGSANLAIRRDTSDGSDSGLIEITGGGAGEGFAAHGRGGAILLAGNEAGTPGRVHIYPGNVASSAVRVSSSDGSIDVVDITGATGNITFKGSSTSSNWTFYGTSANGAGLVLSDVGTERLGFRYNSSDNVVIESLNSSNLFIEASGYVASDTVYNDTTASAANMTIAATGQILRSTSSARYKENIQDATDGLSAIMQLRPRTFVGKRDVGPQRWRHYGFTAEEVAAVMPDLVGYENVDGEMVPGWIEYDYLTAPIVKAIQELAARVEALEAR